MGMFSAAIALFSPGGVGQQKKLPKRPSNDKVETKSTILVINDDPMLLQTVKSLLVKRGFNVLSTSSARKGLEMLHYAARDIRIVVLDYNMPKLNGEETFTFARQLRPKTKLIGLTAMNLDSVPKAYLDGVDKLLTKPVIAAQLIATVDELLGDGQTVLARIEKPA
jgi:CheY-like chemotaxis protein